MLNSITATNSRGESLTIELRSPEKSGFFIRNITGLGVPNVVMNSGQSVYSDGGYYNSSRYSTRNIVFDIGFYDNAGKTIEELRNISYTIFAGKSQVRLQFNTDDKSVFTYGYVETNEPDIFSKTSGFQVSLICFDPMFYSVDSVTTVFSGTVNTFTFPFENTSLVSSTLELSQLLLSNTANVYYEGTIPTGMLIYVTFSGTVVNLSIRNYITGETMAINSSKLAAMMGSGFSAGDILWITTGDRGNKKIVLIRNGYWYNILNALSIDSDWLKLQHGDNVFIYTADSGLSNMQFKISHSLCYGGI